MQLLWLAPALLLRSPPAEQGKGRSTAGREGGSFSLVKEVRRRACLAEAGGWAELLREYLQEAEAAAERRRRAAGRPEDNGERAARLEALDFAARKVQAGCLKAAVQVLTGDGKAPEGPETVEKVRELAAVPADQAERAEIREAC